MFLRALWGPWEGHATPKSSCRQVALLSRDPQLYQEIQDSLRRAAAALQRQRRLSLAELQPKEKGGK